MPQVKKLSLKTKLLIFEYKERFPQMSAEFLSTNFGLDIKLVEKLFNEGEIEVPSKINEEHGQRKKKIYRDDRLLLRRRKNSLHERVPGEKRPMLRRTV